MQLVRERLLVEAPPLAPGPSRQGSEAIGFLGGVPAEDEEVHVIVVGLEGVLGSALEDGEAGGLLEESEKLGAHCGSEIIRLVALFEERYFLSLAPNRDHLWVKHRASRSSGMCKEPKVIARS
mmetsp:Transcript_47313/g.147940  ORF Transcript_47313/g.147940 Transcript_47313/m.147940 type:complete len:123 (-) Transcript_47313:286-654(-)